MFCLSSFYAVKTWKRTCLQWKVIIRGDIFCFERSSHSWPAWSGNWNCSLNETSFIWMGFEFGKFISTMEVQKCLQSIDVRKVERFIGGDVLAPFSFSDYVGFWSVNLIPFNCFYFLHWEEKGFWGSPGCTTNWWNKNIYLDLKFSNMNSKWVDWLNRLDLGFWGGNLPSVIVKT